MANPPFSVKWEPDVLADDVRFRDCPALPPPSKADWAFMLHILHHLKDNGVAVVLEFPGILYRGQREGKVRRWFVENNYIDRVVKIPGNTFEDTAIETCIVVLKKNRTTTDITFEDGEWAETIPYSAVEKTDFNLFPGTYIKREIQKEDVDLAELFKDGRKKTLSVLESELQLEILLCELSNLDLQPFLNELKSLISRYEK